MRVCLRALMILLSCTLALQAQPTVNNISIFPASISEIDALDAQRCILATEERVAITFDQGATWITIDSASTGEPRGYTLSAHGNEPLLYVAPPYDNPNPVLDIHIASNGGRFWEKRTVEIWKYIPSDLRRRQPVTAHITRQDSILLFYPTSVYRISANSTPPVLQSFTSGDSILDAVARGDTALLCTKQGLFLSTDAGSTWHPRLSGAVDQVLLKGIECVTILQADRHILTSRDMGMHWDTIPFPMPPPITGYETRTQRLFSMGDGSSGNLRLLSDLIWRFDNVTYYYDAKLATDYDPVSGLWDRLESLPSQLQYFEYLHDGWFDEGHCWMGSGNRIGYATYSFDTAAPLVVRDQSGYSKRCIRLNWLEIDHGRWDQAVLERSDDNAPWQEVARISPPTSFFSSTYVDSTIDQSWSDIHSYRYRLTKSLRDGGSRRYLSLPVTLDNSTVYLDLLEYILPPRDTWLHYDADGERSSIFLDRIQPVDEYRTDVLLRHMINYVPDAPYRYSLLHFRDEYLANDPFHSHEAYFGPMSASELYTLRDGRLSFHAGHARFWRVFRRASAPPDTIELWGTSGYGWTALYPKTRYVRGLGLVSHFVRAVDIRNYSTDTLNPIYLRLVTSDVGETSTPEILSIESLYPNPFDARRGGTLTIAMREADNASVRVTIHDLLGRLVAILHDGPMDGERHTISWSGRTMNGAGLPSGMYLLRASSPKGVTTRRIIVRGT